MDQRSGLCDIRKDKGGEPMSTNEKVIELRTSNPNLTLKEISISVGVSRERVRQILEKNNLPTSHYRPARNCNIETIPVSDIPTTTGYKFNKIWEALKEIKDNQAIKISGLSISDINRIRQLLKNKNMKTISKNRILYISKG